MAGQLFYNGKIFTSDVQNLFSDSMLVEDGKIRWIGELRDYERWNQRRCHDYSSSCNPETRNPETPERIDLQGRCVIPGIVDSHMHGIMTAQISRQISCLPPEVHSIEELQEKIRSRRNALLSEFAGVDQADRPSSHPRSSDENWIEAWGYDEGKLAEHRSPTRYDLDEVSPDFPVIVMRTCAHSACVNSLALRLAGIDSDTPNPEGGEIARDASGNPTGVLRDSAIHLITKIRPVSNRERMIQNLVDFGELLSADGITTITDLGVFEKTDYYNCYIAASRGGFRQKAALYYIWDYHYDDSDFYISEDRFRTENRIFVAGIKLIGDGSISGRTAWLNTPYLGGEDVGISVCTDEVLEKAVSACKHYRCQLAVHAMGGRAIDRMFARLGDEPKWNRTDAPHIRLEHITEPSEEAILSAAAKGIAFVTQPIFLYSEIESYVKNLGEDRLKKTYPVRTMLDKRVRLALSSDSPANAWAVPFDPFVGIQAAVTRIAYDGTDLGQEEKISVEDAVRLYTVEGAKVLGIADRGILKAGCAADFVILDRNLFEIPSDQIGGTKVLQTFIDGEPVYRNPGF